MISVIIILLRLHKQVIFDARWLFVDIASCEIYLLLPAIRLPMCPAKCKFQLPDTISNLLISGSKLSHAVSIKWPNFTVTDRLTGQSMLVLKSFELPLFHTYKLSKMLNTPFFVHLYIAHNRFLPQIDAQIDD